MHPRLPDDRHACLDEQGTNPHGPGLLVLLVEDDPDAAESMALLLQVGRRSLRRAVFEAQLALGERMYAAGIDDGHLGAQVAALDQHIRQGHPARVEGLTAERRTLLVRLAAAALEEDAPLPGADAEYETARKAQAALANRDGR